MSVQVRSGTADRWSDLVSVFGVVVMILRGAGAASSSVPQPANPRRVHNRGRDNRGAIRHELAQALAPPGLLAYVDDEPLGWTRIGPRSDFPRVTGNRASTKVLTDDPGAWWVTWFAVNRLLGLVGG